MSGNEWNHNWEEAYLRQSSDAAVGRLFRGLIHNLNGIMQALCMQSDLLALLFPGMQKLLAEALAAAPPGQAREQIEQICTTFGSRARLLEQMQEKVQAAQEILHRTRMLNAVTEGDPAYTVESVVRVEMEFLLADSFFKHRVQKELNLSPGLPPVRKFGVELHQLMYILLTNAIEALRQEQSPLVLIEARQAGAHLFLTVEDNGPGIAEHDLGRIFEPFFTTKRGHHGLGLFLAKKIMDGCEGIISYTSSPGTTRFQLEIPQEKI